MKLHLFHTKKTAKKAGVVHSFDRNGALVVDAFSLLTSATFRRQLMASAKVEVKANKDEEQQPAPEGAVSVG